MVSDNCDPALAGGLAQRLDDIDAVLATDRRELARTAVQLPWPPHNSVIHDRPAAPLAVIGGALLEKAHAAGTGSAKVIGVPASQNCAGAVLGCSSAGAGVDGA